MACHPDWPERDRGRKDRAGWWMRAEEVKREGGSNRDPVKGLFPGLWAHKGEQAWGQLRGSGRWGAEETWPLPVYLTKEGVQESRGCYPPALSPAFLTSKLGPAA